MGTPVFLKQNSEAACKGPFTVAQVKKLLDQNKIKETALFSLDQEKWYGASKNLPKLFIKYASDLSNPAPRVEEKADATIVVSEQSVKEKASKAKPKAKSKKTKPRSKVGVTSAPAKKTVSSVSSRAKAKKSSGGGLIGFILLILVLVLAGGGAFLHRQASEEILMNADKALEAFCKSLQLDASYELSIALTLDKIILKNVHLKSEDNHVDLRAMEVECSLPVLMTMGWFLTDEIKIEQPQPLLSKISGFQGEFIEDGFAYRANQITLDFFGSFAKKELVIDGEVAKGKVLMTLSPEVLANLTKAEADKGTELPREGEALVIKFSGPFKDIIIEESADAWREIADLSFR